MRAVNLIPSDQRAGAGGTMGRSEGAVYVVLGFVACLALLLLLYGKARHEAATHKAQAAALNAKAQRAQEAATQLAPFTNFIVLREQREQAVSQLVDSRFDWAHVIHELGRVLPPGDTSISSFTGSVGSASATSASSAGGSGAGSSSSAGAASSSTSSSAGAGSGSASGSGSSGSAVSSATPPGSVPTLTLSGCATTQSIVALTLNRLRLIDGVSDVSLQSSTQSSSAAGSSGPAGGCGRGPAFNLGVTFQPLPSVNEARAAAVAANVSSGGAR